MDVLEGLNPQQFQAVTHVKGPLLILAGAGSGKTRVITQRIAYLIRSEGVPPWNILAVTFTNKAAEEMRERVAQLLGTDNGAGGPILSTFHSFCVRLLRRDGGALADLRPGFTRRFLIYDEDDQLAVVKSVYRHLGLDEKIVQYRAALSRISRAKCGKLSPEEFQRSTKDPAAPQVALVYEAYERRLREANAVDFDDLLLEAVRLLRHDETVRRAYNERLRYVMIDEYQDTNRNQYELMRLLTEQQQNVCVVGDEDQSIYSWRGADIRNILDFERDYPDAVIIRLEQNYRSTKRILEAASAVVAHNEQRKGKWLWTEAGTGEPIGVYRARDAENEALFIADAIEKILARNPGDRVAVLYRTNFQSRQIEEALRRYSIKYHVVGGFSFYQRAEIKDILAYLKLLVSPYDPVSLLRIINTPARGIGRTTAEHLERYAAERGCTLWSGMGRMLDGKELPARAEAALRSFRTMVEALAAKVEDTPLGDVVKEVVERTGYRRMLESEGTPAAESRLENLDELINAAVESAVRGENLSEFLDHAALVAESDSIDEHAQVSLLTVHNAKGLEFPVVFIAGLEDGLFPHARSANSPMLMEEERRLFYVGMTRAQKRLVLTWAAARRKYGGGALLSSIPSGFLREVPPELTENLGATVPEVDLFSEAFEVREAAKRNTYTGKTYNSLEAVAQFFQERGKQPPAPSPGPAISGSCVARKPVEPPRKKRKFGAGSTVRHPRYGTGMVLKREGEGDEAKLTVSFPGYGLKKLVAKYAGLTFEE